MVNLPKFIKVNSGQIINVDCIKKIEFISDDVYLGLFPEAKYLDFISFNYGRIYLKNGEEINLNYDLYLPEEGQKKKLWREENMNKIRKFWRNIEKVLSPEKIKEV